jgi:hypothetical protein
MGVESQFKATLRFQRYPTCKHQDTREHVSHTLNPLSLRSARTWMRTAVITRESITRVWTLAQA